MKPITKVFAFVCIGGEGDEGVHEAMSIGP